MLVALALYTSTAHAGIPAGFGGTPVSVRMQTSLTEDQRALPKHSQRLPETSVPRATPRGKSSTCFAAPRGAGSRSRHHQTRTS
jgi:hypothetical protein